MFLLARILIYFIMDVFDDPRVHLLGISLTSACLHGIKTLLGERVYRRKWINCLDTVSILNILVFSLMSLYSIGSRQNQEIAAYISVGVAIVTFLIVIFCRAMEQQH